MTKFDLQISDKIIAFHIGIGFLGEYQDKHDIDIHQLIEKLDKNPWKMIPSLMYESALYRSKGKLKLSYDEFLDLIDDDGGYSSKGLTGFLNNFMNSLVKDVPKEDTEGEDSKKK